MKKKLSIFLVLIICEISLGQVANVEANVEMDYFGNLYIETQLNDLDINNDLFLIDNDILINKNYATLLRGVMVGKTYFAEYKPKTNKIIYNIDSSNRKSSSTIKRANFFFISLPYLPLSKSTINKNKKFNLTFKLKEKYKVIFPDSSDLKKTFKYPPPIIAGEFENNQVLGFEVYSLKKENRKKEKIESIINIISDSYKFYQKKYPKSNKLPKIIFLPLDGVVGAKALDGAIVFDSNILDENANLEKRLIAHEVAHLWWGVGGIRFENDFFNEGIAEFMSLKYMEYIGEIDYLKKAINTKYYRIEGLLNEDEIIINKIFNSQKKAILNYDLTPLLLFNIEDKKNNLFDSLSEFYINFQNFEGFIPVSKLESFLKQKGYKSIFKEGVLPDYFIIEEKDKIIVKGIYSLNEKIEVELTDKNNKKVLKTFLFSNENSQYILNTSDYEKVVIDPQYKLLQFSRLNDVWVNNQKSIFSKNRYFSIIETESKVLSLSNNVVSYIFSKDNVSINDITCVENFWLINKIDKLIKEINKDEEIIITGASTYLRDQDEDLNRIDIKVAYFCPRTHKSKLIAFYIYYDKNMRFLQNFKFEAELNETEE